MQDGVKIGFGVAAILLLNYVFNELMDESGLHVVMLTARLPPGANDTTPATARVEDLNRASRRSDTLQFRARQADPIITCHYSRRQVHTQPLRRAALEGKSNPSKQHGVITTCRR